MRGQNEEIFFMTTNKNITDLAEIMYSKFVASGVKITQEVAIEASLTPFSFSLQEVPKYRKNVLKKGDKRNFPQKGDTVACFYTGKLQDGTVFDTNVITGRCGTVVRAH